MYAQVLTEVDEANAEEVARFERMYPDAETEKN